MERNMLRAYRKYFIALALVIFFLVVMEYEWTETESVSLRNKTLMEMQRLVQSDENQIIVKQPPKQPPIAKMVYVPKSGMFGRSDTNISNVTKHDDLFRKEIYNIYKSIKLPSACDDVDKSPPQTVKSQSKYAGCPVPRVPNIIHLVWLYGGAYSMTFRQLLSALSMLRFIQPCTILFWYDGSAPSGDYWQHFLRNVTAQHADMRMLNITVPNKIWDKKIAYKEHKTDIIRFEVLKHFGGMYMDLDVLILKSVRPLRCYDYTLGREDPIRLTASLVFSVPNSPFLLKIIENYKHYRTQWSYNSVDYPHELSLVYPGLIHIEANTINHPSWHTGELNAIFDSSCFLNLSRNYALHLWNHNSKHKNKVEDPESIKSMRSTFGQVARFIYYGHTGPCRI